MRIVYVSTIERGGPLTHLRALAPAMQRRGFDVLVVCANESVAAEFGNAGVAALALPLSHKADVGGAARLWPALRDAAIVHSHDRRAGLYGRLIGALHGATVVHTLHGLPEDLALRLGRNVACLPALSRWQRVRHWTYARVESQLAAMGVVIAPSRFMAGWLRAQNVPASRIEVIGHWIDMRPDMGLDAPPKRPRKREGPLIVGFVGRLESWKGLDVLIDACAGRTNSVRIEVFGDGAERETLQRRAAARQVNARFHGDVADVRDRLDELDALVAPSRVENLPFAIIEAMAHGLPVIGTLVGGVPELIEDGRTGLLVDPDDSIGLARAIDRLADSPALAHALGRAAANKIARDFSEACVAPRFENLYRRIAGSPLRGARASV